MRSSDKSQLGLFESLEQPGEDPAFLSEQLLTYIGNKRLLLGAIGEAVIQVRNLIGKEKLRVLDGFSGSGVVSRLMKQYASEVVVNDLENYAAAVGRCYLSNRSEVDFSELESTSNELNRTVDAGEGADSGFFERLYAPEDDDNVQPGERVFYTRENARRLDAFRQLLDTLPDATRSLLLGPLLSSASVHANTAGVFKGFYKDKDSGIGKLGGSGADALRRIKGQIRLRPPVLSRFDTAAVVSQGDANEQVPLLGHFDLAYFDPPYNQHPYGSNYFMLNLLCDYVEPDAVSKVSGIPKNWNRSAYNVRKDSLTNLTELVTNVDADFVLLSFNDDGFISPEELRNVLTALGDIQEFKIRHNTFRGSRNLRARKIHVTEHLYLLQKRGM